jgi:hypothetical protein
MSKHSWEGTFFVLWPRFNISEFFLYPESTVQEIAMADNILCSPLFLNSFKPWRKSFREVMKFHETQVDEIS